MPGLTSVPCWRGAAERWLPGALGRGAVAVPGGSALPCPTGTSGRLLLEPEPPPPPRVPPDLLDMLRSFDLAWEYGPCTGITRLQRWERAAGTGAEPPVPTGTGGCSLTSFYPPSLWHEYGL
uniref:DNA polymerase delta subunit 4 n=1 Tax=Anas platyrhynchos TaxID=8839 RepID=A0A8B9QUV1_ANAPL